MTRLPAAYLLVQAMNMQSPCMAPQPSLLQICAVRRGLEALLHSHGFALEDSLITVGWLGAAFLIV